MGYRLRILLLIFSSNCQTACAEEPTDSLPPYKSTAASSHSELLVTSDTPDPGVIALREGSDLVYYLVATSRTFPIKRSKDLKTWEDTGAAILPSGRAPWSPDGRRNWAPEIHKIGERFVAFYTASDQRHASLRSDPLAIGVAWADSILGPYHHAAEPLVAGGQHGSIDATFYTENDQSLLYWKTDGNCCGAQTHIMVQELNADGLALKAGSQPQIVLSSDSKWDRGLIEAPWLIRRGDWVYLFYSGAYFWEDYKSGVARARSPWGPFEKMPQPFLSGDASLRAPGHGSILQVAAEQYVYLHHAYYDGNQRSLFKTTLSWKDEWPGVSPEQLAH